MRLPSAKTNRDQHYANLNQWKTAGFAAYLMRGRWWEINEEIFDEFLNMLPPRYCTQGFRMSEHLTGDIAATYVQIGTRYFCGFTDHDTFMPQDLIRVVA